MIERLYEKVCALDYGRDCYNLRFMYSKGEGVRQSTQKALEYFGEACDLESQLVVKIMQNLNYLNEYCFNN
ncbi:MAG: sel1 repeat family protein [Methylococcales symbiont of Hymedesmia sp. n. MRB-2018]|nr:MAG: sel1 repeat family protein [Methylococcales symbiont of Hymedesmia sp. n. MRB-2018]KAF3984021.1 MAG: sel1 repeat family protein [Methylococcales symbiont of Hymedesmia sp. n. MRB-2018]